MTDNNCYELGKAAYTDGKPRDPMKDQCFVQYIQTGESASHAPKSVAATMSETQKNKLQDRLKCWKDGWDQAHKED